MKHAVAAITVMGIIALAGSGCSTGRGDRMLKAYEAFQRQPRTYKAVSLQNVDAISLYGSNMVVEMEAPLNPLSAMPQEPDAIRAIMDGTGRIVGYGVVGYLGRYALQAPRTVSPTVVQPQVYTLEGEATTATPE